MSNPYLHPMQPWPSLARYARRIQLPQSQLQLFIFDTGSRQSDASAPQVLIHGLGDEADTWRYLFESLAQHRRVIALDLPGFGRSDKPRRAYSLSFFRDVMIELLDFLNIPQVSLVGHSLGAIIAPMVALAQPQRLTDLVLIDGCLSPRPQRVSFRMLLWLLPFIAERNYNGLRGRPDAAYGSLAAYYADITRLPEADRTFLYQRVNQRVWSDGQRDAYFSVLRRMPEWMARNFHGTLSGLGRLRLPTVVMWGREDRIMSVAAGQALVDVQKNSRLVLIPGSGHMPHQEQPTAVIEAMAVTRSPLPKEPALTH